MPSKIAEKNRYGDIARDRLHNSLYFCVFRYPRAVKQKVWNEAENRERDWRETHTRPTDLYGHVRLVRVRVLRHVLPTSLLILRKKPDCFAIYRLRNIAPLISCCFLFFGGSRGVTWAPPYFFVQLKLSPSGISPTYMKIGICQ